MTTATERDAQITPAPRVNYILKQRGMVQTVAAKEPAKRD